MRRSLGVLLLALAASFGAASPAWAVPFSSGLSAQGSDFGGPFSPDFIVMSLPMGGPVTFAAAPPTGFSSGGTWSYSVSNGGYGAFLQRTTPLTGQTAPVSWLQNFDGPTGEYSFDVDWSLFQRDGGGAIVRFDGGGGSTVAVAIPEPSTWLILGLGGLVAAARTRRRRAAPVTP